MTGITVTEVDTHHLMLDLVTDLRDAIDASGDRQRIAWGHGAEHALEVSRAILFKLERVGVTELDLHPDMLRLVTEVHEAIEVSRDPERIAWGDGGEHTLRTLHAILIELEHHQGDGDDPDTEKTGKQSTGG